MVRYFDDRRRNPCRGSKRLAFDRYGAIQVHNFYVEKRVLDSEHGNGGPPHSLEFLTVESQKHVQTSSSSNHSDTLNFLDQCFSVLFNDFRHVFGALHRYRVPLQGPSLVVQDTDHQELCRSVVHRGPVLRVQDRFRRDRLVLPHDYL